MKNRKGKKWLWVLLVIIVLIGAGGIGLYKYIQYRNSNTYKLLELGYTENEVKQIEKHVKKVDTVLNLSYNKDLPAFIKEPYFLEKNMKEYLDYQKQNPKIEKAKVVALVNVKQHKKHYTNTQKTDTSKKEKMLVNKYYYLDKNYDPKDIKPISIQYAYANNKISDSIYGTLKEMFKDAKEEGVRLIVNSGYRSYEEQKKTYDQYVDSKGENWADDYAARPGFSEHQTGIAVDIIGVGTNRNTFEDSEAYKWLQDHAHEYGFILRYPKDKEDITGYTYEAWHYRYVGKEIASKIKKLKITFDEYYAFYIE